MSENGTTPTAMPSRVAREEGSYGDEGSFRVFFFSFPILPSSFGEEEWPKRTRTESRPWGLYHYEARSTSVDISI